jgi:hypothetical protein
MVKKTVAKKVIKKLTKKTKPKPKKYITEDGYVFKLKKDGTLTDGDMTFDSLKELKKSVDVKPYSGKRLDKKADGGMINNKPKKMKAGGIALRGHGKAFLKGNR